MPGAGGLQDLDGPPPPRPLPLHQAKARDSGWRRAWPHQPWAEAPPIVGGGVNSAEFRPNVSVEFGPNLADVGRTLPPNRSNSCQPNRSRRNRLASVKLAPETSSSSMQASAHTGCQTWRHVGRVCADFDGLTPPNCPSTSSQQPPRLRPIPANFGRSRQPRPGLGRMLPQFGQHRSKFGRVRPDSDET